MKDAIVSHLPREFPWAESLHCFDTIPSTNDFLKELARKGAPHGTVVIADHQTGGHGRHGDQDKFPAVCLYVHVCSSRE